MNSGLSAQTSPSCEDLSFLLGIQGCTTQDKTLFTVTVKAKNAGSGTAGFTGVDIIGEGVSISSVSSGGTYTLTAPEIIPEGEEEEEEEVIPEGETEEGIGEEEEEILPEGETEEGEGEEVVQEEGVPAGGLLAAIGAIPLNLKVLLGIAVVVIIGLIILWLIRKKKTKV